MLHPGTKDQRPLVMANKPWEKTLHYGSIVKTTAGGPYQLFYTCFNKSAADGPVTPTLASSRDLMRWDRSSRGPLIEPGLPESWNDAAIYSSNYFRASADKVEQGRLAWRQDLGRLAGQQVKLRFHLTNGDLYSYWIS